MSGSTNKLLGLICLVFLYSHNVWGQADTIILGKGNNANIIVSMSDEVVEGSASQTTSNSGFLPNENKASRFLSQATLGYNYADIEMVTQQGIEDWLESQLAMERGEYLLQSVRDYVTFAEEKLGESVNSSDRMWKYAWWQYQMGNSDLVRQRVALALSEIIVVSEISNFNGNGYALADFYDLFDTNCSNFHELNH